MSVVLAVPAGAVAVGEQVEQAGDERYWSGSVPSADFCLNLSLGGPRTFPFDSDGDGVADVCSLPYTRREAVARQNARELLAGEWSGEYSALVRRACYALRSSSFGDDADDLEGDVCATGRGGVMPETPPPDDERYWSGSVPSADFCLNLSLGGPRTFPFDSDGDGVADVCSLPYTRREAVARQNALDKLAEKYALRMAYLVDDACKAIIASKSDFGDAQPDLDVDVCAAPPPKPPPLPPPAPPEAPDPPGVPVLVDGDQEIEVSWTAPNSNRSEIIDYDVRHRKCTATGNNPCDTTGNWTELDDTGDNATSTATTATITVLTNGTTYEVQVRASNEIGDGSWSDSASATPAGVPGMQGTPAVAPVASADGMTVSWLAPANNGAPIIDYDVRHRECTATGNNPCGTYGNWAELDDTGSNATSTATTATISGLISNKIYQVQVSSQNRKGNSVWSASSAACKLAKPAKPAQPTVANPSSGRLDASWTAPSGCGITDYEVKVDNARVLIFCNNDDNLPRAVDDVSGTSYTFTGLENSIHARAQVRAVNAVGESDWSDLGTLVLCNATDSVQILPAAPAAPTLGVGSQSLLVNWLPPADLSTTPQKLDDYDLQYQKRNDDNTWPATWTTVYLGTNHTATTATITGLINGKTYRVQVQASYTNSGCGTSNCGRFGFTGRWSASSAAERPGLRAPVAPAAPSLSSGNAKLVVGWSPPRSDGGSDITDYDVRYCDNSTGCDDSGEWTDHAHTGTTTATTISSLTNAAAYQVQVRASNDYDNDDSADTGPWSPSATETAGRPAKPNEPALSPNYHSAAQIWSISASWSPPSDDGGSAITDYDVQYRRQNNNGTWPTWTDQPHTGTATTATISGAHGLINGKNYQVRMRARNARGLSVWSNAASVTLGTPSGVRTFQGNRSRYCTTPSTCGAASTVKVGISLSWQPPDSYGSSLTEYDVQYRRVLDTDWTVHDASGIPLNTRSDQYTGTTITPNPSPASITAYEVRVRAQNARGWGPWKRLTVIVWPLPSAPAAPTVTATSNNLTISWSPPSSYNDTGAPIVGYVIQYRAKPSDCDTSKPETHPCDWKLFKAGYYAVAEDDTSTSFTTRRFSTSYVAGIEYQARVAAINDVGRIFVLHSWYKADAVWSTAGSATPAAAVPYAPSWPAATRGDSRLVVTWGFPHGGDGGSTITDYDVRYCTDSTGCDANSEWTELDDTGNHATSTATTATITGLTNDSAYQVQVRAGNAQGDGNWTGSVLGTPSTTAPTGPGAPTGVRILPAAPGTSSRGRSMYLAGWTSPSNDGGSTILDHQIRFREKGATTTYCGLDEQLNEVRSAWCVQPRTQRSIGNLILTAGKTYEVQVRLLSNWNYNTGSGFLGIGDWSVSVEETSGRPMPPVALKVAPGNTELFPIWSAGNLNGATWTGYNLRYRTAAVSNTPAGSWTTMAATSKISGLINNTKYEVQVQTKSNLGTSDWSLSTFATPTSP